jgi:hypothetical protein
MAKAGYGAILARPSRLYEGRVATEESANRMAMVRRNLAPFLKILGSDFAEGHQALLRLVP